jgi:site-specific recombinase XerD
VQVLLEEFLQHLRHERGQAEHTQRTFAALLGHFIAWAGEQGITDWHQVELPHLLAFLRHLQTRPVAREPEDSKRRLSTETLYLNIAALRAFYRFAETEKLLPANIAEHLTLPRRWKRLPKALSDAEITQLLAPEPAATPSPSAPRPFSSWPTPRACAWRNCAACASNNCTSTPAS